MSNPKYFPPKYHEDSFNCPYCGVLTTQYWYTGWYKLSNQLLDFYMEASRCFNCNKFSYWYDKKLIIPANSTIELPHNDLPDLCKSDYMEARDIFSKSPRSSAALLRLCIQKLMKELGESGENINVDIASLVKKGLPPAVQKSLDICRVVGNNAVHPGEINIDDSPIIAEKLFDLVNFIVQERITRLREIDELYSLLPDSSKDAIEKRDSK